MTKSTDTESDTSDSDSNRAISLLKGMPPPAEREGEVFAVKTQSNNLLIRNGILIALLAQNSGYTLLRKLSTSTEDVSSREILLAGEIIKFFVSAFIVVNSDEPSSSVGEGMAKLKWVLSNSKKMFILAGIYLAMNVLSFVSLTFIGAGEFSVW